MFNIPGRMVARRIQRTSTDKGSCYLCLQRREPLEQGSRAGMPPRKTILDVALGRSGVRTGVWRQLSDFLTLRTLGGLPGQGWMNLAIGLNSQFWGHGILLVAGGFKHLSSGEDLTVQPTLTCCVHRFPQELRIYYFYSLNFLRAY